MLKIFSRNSITTTAINTVKNLSNKSGKANVQRSKRPTAATTTNRMDRRWEPTQEYANEHRESAATGEKQYKLLSYNILAQDLVTEHIYIYWGIDPVMLKWEHRLRRLSEEIVHVNPDILCLQEMQFSHLKILVKHIRGQRKLEYVFKKKTGHRSDGCAIIYDKDKFVLLEEKGVEYFTPDIATLNRENVALMAKFNVRGEPAKQVVIATTHLLYNPKRHDVRMAQADVLLKAINDFAVDVRRNVNLPVILTGDFNCVPDSPPYMELTKHVQSIEHNAPSKIAASIYKKSTSLQMIPIDFGYKCASTYQEQWILVDYVLYSIANNRKRIKVCSVYKLPTVQDCRAIGQIPNKYLGSDHYSLGITFALE